MKKKLLQFSALTMAAASLIFSSCNKEEGINPSDVNALINGPNSIKGTISGTMQNDTAFNFPYDYHVTTTDENSGSQSYVTPIGDTLLRVWQYFYFDRNGLASSGDKLSASGKFLSLELQLKVSVNKKNEKEFTLLSSGSKRGNRLYGMWQNIIPDGRRFVYGTLFYRSYTAYLVPPTYTVENLKYDQNTQILSGSFTYQSADNNDVQNSSGNTKATTINGDFQIYVPKVNFQVVNGADSSNGNIG